MSPCLNLIDHDEIISTIMTNTIMIYDMKLFGSNRLHANRKCHDVVNFTK